MSLFPLKTMFIMLNEPAILSYSCHVLTETEAILYQRILSLRVVTENLALGFEFLPNSKWE